MTLQWSTSSKMMCGATAISLGWLLFSGCFGCDDKQHRHPGRWVSCVAFLPTLMHYEGDIATPIIASTTFTSSDWDCTHPDSPKYKGSAKPIYPTGTLAGPLNRTKQRQASSSFPSVFLPQRLLALPFLPPPAPVAPDACDPSFPDVLQTNHIRGLLTRISTCPFRVITTIPVVSRPLQVEVTPDGTTALVTSFDNAVNFIDLATNRVTFTLMTDPSINPQGIAISPDGSRAYITSFNSGNPVVATIDIAMRKIIGTVRVAAYPQGLTLTPDGSQLWVTHPLGGAVFVIDTLSNTVASFIAVNGPVDVAFNSTATRAYITASGSPGTVQVVDTATYQILKSYNVGAGAADISMAYGDEWLVVNNYDGNSISIIDLLRDVVKTTAVGTAPQGISWVP